MTDYQFRVRQEARNAIARLVKDAGGEMVTRPVIRSEPGGPETREPEPLAGIAAAVALRHAADRVIRECARYAREDGQTWAQIGEALGVSGGEDEAYRYAQPAYRGISPDWFTWTCPSCRSLIRDYGPEAGSPHDAEQGHAEDCARFAETVRTWDTQRKDDGNA